MGTFEPRTYRRDMAGQDLVAFQTAQGETDLHIQVGLQGGNTREAALGHLKQMARETIRQARRHVQAEILLRRGFGTSLEPLPDRPGAPELIRQMEQAARRAGVGPMAAVAGAIAEAVGRALLAECDEVIVENGGDVFLCTRRQRTVAVYAGRSPLSNRVGVAIPATQTVGICTSSGMVGHSLSTGKADAALIVADDVAFADAAATALGNRITTASDIEPAIGWASQLAGVRQALAICGGAMGVWGQFEIEKLEPQLQTPPG